MITHCKRERKIDSQVDVVTDEYLSREAKRKGITKSMLIFQLLRELATGITAEEKEELKAELSEEFDRHKLELDNKFNTLKLEIDNKFSNLKLELEEKFAQEVESFTRYIIKEPEPETRYEPRTRLFTD